MFYVSKNKKRYPLCIYDFLKSRHILRLVLISVQAKSSCSCVCARVCVCVCVCVSRHWHIPQGFICLEIVIISGHFIIISPVASYFVLLQAELCLLRAGAVHCLMAKAVGIARGGCWPCWGQAPGSTCLQPPPWACSHLGRLSWWAGCLSLHWLFSFIVKYKILPFPCLSNHKAIGS